MMEPLDPLTVRARRLLDRVRGCDIEDVCATIEAMEAHGVHDARALSDAVRFEDEIRRSYEEDDHDDA